MTPCTCLPSRNRNKFVGVWRAACALAIATLAAACGSVTNGSPDGGSNAADGATAGADAATNAADAVPNDPADAAPPDAALPLNYAFVSPETVTGAMGGLAGADQRCNDWASAAGLPGNYRAILSDATTDAASRLAGARGWIRPDGRPVADRPADLFYPNAPLAPLRIAADGSDQGPVSAWSASGNDGVYKTVANGTDCNGWTSGSDTLLAWYGFANTTAEWLDRGTRWACSSQAHIYCLQVDHNTPLSVGAYAENGRRMFVSSGTFSVSSGLAGADALCAADAASNSALNGATFLAFLATDGSSAASRFSPSATPIIRLDGLRIADNFSALISNDLIHPPTLRIDGEAYSWRVATGAATPTDSGMAATTCNSWSTAASGNLTEGFSYSTSRNEGDRRWFGNTGSTCANHSNTVPVYCLEVEN